MFVLVKDEEKFVLVPNKKFYTVGRLSTDLILKEDLSISRTHVRLHLAPAGAGAVEDVLKMEDLGSKYGTYLNGDIAKNKKTEAKVLITLEPGTLIRFGAMSSVWQVTQLRLVTTTSSLTRAQIQELEELLRSLGGSVVQNWTDECSYLTMNEASVTVKLLHAMLNNTPIVTCAYWRDLLQAARRIHVTEGWPQTQDYQPTNMDVKWRPERTKLFAGKTFVFMNRKHFEIYGSVVQKAGGSCKDLNTGVRKTFLTKKDVVVIQYVPSSQSQATETINSIQEILEQAGLRIVQEYEIGMALINCSTKEFCNPSQKLVYDSMPTTESMTSSLAANSSIIIPNTEQPRGSNSNENKATEMVIPEWDKKMDKPKTQPERPKRIVASSQRVVRKRNHAQFIDSSDEEESCKMPSQLTRKRKKPNDCPIVVNSSDEDKNTDKAKRSKSNNVMFVDSSADDDDENERSKSLPQKTLKSKAKKPAIEENLVKKAKVVTVSPRRSPRSIGTKIQTPEKPTLTVAQEPNDSDSNEGDLFQFKTTKTNDLPSIKEKSTEPPVGRISVRNFITKSQNIHVNSETQHAAPQASQAEPRKRLRLELLSESDSGNEDNLFNFSDTKKQKFNNNQKNASGEDSLDNELFNFRSKDREAQNNSNEQDQDFICTEPFVPNSKETEKKSNYVVFQSMPKPRVINVSGWLSCSGLHNKLKSEPNGSLVLPPDALEVKHESGLDVKKEDDNEADSKAEHLKWLASIKDNIQVQMSSLQISSRSHDAVDATNDDPSIIKNTSKNFKKFVRKINLRPQQRILETTRLQLANGMVSSL